MNLEGTKREWKEEIHKNELKAGAEFGKAVGCGIIATFSAVGVIRHVFGLASAGQEALDLTAVISKTTDDDFVD